MSHSRNWHQKERPRPDRSTLLVRAMSAMIGLTFGFAGGRFFTPAPPAAETVPLTPEETAAALPPADAPLAERIAAAPDDAARQALLAGLVEEWRQPAPGRGSAFLLRLLFAPWVEHHGGAALAAAMEIGDMDVSHSAIEAVMTEWGLRNPAEAAQAAATIPWAAGQQQAMESLVRAAALKNPVETWALIPKLTPAPQATLPGIAGAEWLRQDPGPALRTLSGNDRVVSASRTGSALGRWLFADPSGFIAWRKSAPDAALPRLQFAAGDLAAPRMARLLHVLETTFDSAPAAAAWLQKIAGTGVITAWLEGPAGLPKAENPPGTGPESWLAKTIRAGGLERLAAQPGIPPEEVLEQLVRHPEPDDAARLAPAVTRRLLEAAPTTAAPRLFAGDLTHPVRKAAAMAAAGQLITTQPLALLSSLDKLAPDPGSATALRHRALRQLALTSPAGVLEWVAAHPGSGAPEDAVTGALGKLTPTDPARAMQWVRDSAPREFAPALAGNVFRVWIKSDRAAALSFLGSQPQGAARDGLIALLVDSDTAVNDKVFAGNMLPETFRQALGLSENAVRIATLNRILFRMAQWKIPAGGLLNHPQLRPEDRAALTPAP